MPNALAPLKPSREAELLDLRRSDPAARFENALRSLMSHRLNREEWLPEETRSPAVTLGGIGDLAAEAVTPYGNYVSARDAVEDFQGGHPVSGSLNALLAIPGLGIVGAVGRGAKRAGKAADLFEAAHYHGGNALYDVIDPSRYGQVKYGRNPDWQRLSEQGFWTGKDKALAQQHAQYAAAKGGGEPITREFMIRRVSDPKIGTVNNAVVELDPKDFSSEQMLGAVLDARKEGAQVLTLKGVPSNYERGGDPTELTLVFKGNEFLIRDPKAKLDRSRLNESGLMLGLSGLGLGFGGFIGDPAGGKGMGGAPTHEGVGEL